MLDFALAATTLAVRSGASTSPDQPSRIVAAAAEPPAPPLSAPPAVAVDHPVPGVDTLMAGRSSSCVYARGPNGVVAAQRVDVPLIPASTQKILVGVAALDVLGPDHRFTTQVAALPAIEGTVTDLYVIGGADPYLATPEYAAFVASAPRWRDMVPTPMDSLADAVVTSGIRRVTGSVVADASRHEAVGYVPTWKNGYVLGGSVSPISALTVNGGWAVWAPKRQAVENSTLHAAAQFTRMLRERGIEVVQDPRVASRPPGTTSVAAVHSAPVSSVVTGMLRASDNVVAEMLTREIGLRLLGEGTTQAGTTAIRDSLAGLGVDVSGVSLTDGSGLDRGNRATCRALVDALHTSPGGVDVTRMLAVSGQSGTLWSRMRDGPLAGRVHAKTGWIGGVVGLSGAVGDVKFAILQNEADLAPGRAVEEQVVALLAGG